MNDMITPFQKENLTKALALFIEAVRTYFIRLLVREFGEDEWIDRYEDLLNPDHRARLVENRIGNWDPADMIDYANLANFCYKYRELLRPDFRREANEWGINFKKINDLRNQANHYNSNIARDTLAQFWILTRSFARHTGNQPLFDALTNLENARPPEENATATSAPNKPGEASPGTEIPRAEVPNAHYFLPILIRGQKAQVIHLCPEDETSNAYPREFLYEQNAEQIHLFSLIEGAFQGRTSADRHQICRIRSLVVVGKDLVVGLEKVDTPDGATVETPGNISVRTDATGKSQAVYVTVGAAFERIIFNLKNQEKNYRGAVRTAFAPPAQIVDLALDFGSEASQVVVHHREHVGKLNRKELVTLMQERFFADLSGPLHQQDPDPELFRSQVFVLKDNVVMDQNAMPNQFEGQDLVRTLTEKAEIENLKNTHALIPNSKLAHLGVYNFRIHYRDRDANPYRAEESEFSTIVPDVQQTVINHFLHTLLHNIDAQKNDQKERFINIKFLVPNILEQSRLTRLVNQTYQFFDQPEIRQRYHIGGVEVTTLSESDASFLGYWNRANIPQRHANYLIVDVGKGTTDFSIIKSNHDYHLSSEYRAGFIGAGNVITYAFIDTILSAVLGGPEASWEERRRLLKIIASPQTDISVKYHFLEMVERIKHDFQGDNTNQGYLQDLIPAQTVEDIRKRVRENTAVSSLLFDIAKALEEVLKQQKSIRDEFGFINNAVQKIVGKLKYQLDLADTDSVGRNFEKLNRILLTGRGFLFRKLVDEMRRELGEGRGSRDRIVIRENRSDRSNELKKICLSGAFSGRTINYDSNLVGIPSLHTLTEVRTPQGSYTRRTIQKGAGDPTPRTRTDALGEYLHKLFKDEDYHDDEPETTPPPSTDTLPPLLQFLTRGAQFRERYVPNIHAVHISGVKYRCDLLPTGAAIDLLFDGEEFWLRTDQGLAAISYPLDFLASEPMVWQTLFPFFDAVADAQTPIDNALADSDSEI
ncbi:hypothetical protein [Persicitalea jodogahamensis]|uniref:Swt1-like HEPN domain-containing protein n=1 Tax=Persicitalea jodogahamensis TaxID=402147 RepID=A0A8J3GCG2_9BACT|nr:hypothetical protein [Persicitalea jodogahamensis]GHB88843.1 hypothetical protein GCM10007390_51180 [Persicitalea jodogahamensis]